MYIRLYSVDPYVYHVCQGFPPIAVKPGRQAPKVQYVYQQPVDALRRIAGFLSVMLWSPLCAAHVRSR